MYNRYIPQPDGSYRRKRMDEPHFERQQLPLPSVPNHTEQPEERPPACPQDIPHPQQACPQQSTGSFLQQLLPKDFDAGDLMVIILLLLIAGDSEKERNNALLTLALYFIM